MPPDTDWTLDGTTVTPNPGTRGVYDVMYEQYWALNPATRTQVHARASLQEQAH